MNPSKQKFLGGKVTKETLPPVQPGKGPQPSGPKRLLLPQGELASFYDGDEPVRYIAYMELRAGAIRGNHLHRVKREFVYIISGEVLLVAEDPENHERVSVSLAAGDLVFIETGIAHSLKVVQPGQAVEFSPTSYNPSDTERFSLI